MQPSATFYVIIIGILAWKGPPWGRRGGCGHRAHPPPFAWVRPPSWPYQPARTAASGGESAILRVRVSLLRNFVGVLPTVKEDGANRQTRCLQEQDSTLVVCVSGSAAGSPWKGTCLKSSRGSSRGSSRCHHWNQEIVGEEDLGRLR